MRGETFAQVVESFEADLRGAVHQFFLLDDLQRCQPGGAGHRILLVRVMAERSLGSNVQMLSGNDSSERENPSAQSFTEHDDVRHDLEMFEREKFASAAQGDGDFVENEERAMFIAGGANAFP